jgi:uncharacterized membrane protein YidH (DUF202 family)
VNGLQAERTVLAWWRTMLAVAATAALIARSADAGAERGAAVVLTVLGVVLVAVAAARRQRAITREVVTASSAWTVAALVAGVGVLLVAGVTVIL